MESLKITNGLVLVVSVFIVIVGLMVILPEWTEDSSLKQSPKKYMTIEEEFDAQANPYAVSKGKEESTLSSFIVIGVVGGLVFILVMLFTSSIPIYNKINELSVTVDVQAAQLQSTYQRRLELIPNLVNTVKGYASHEQETLRGVMDARARATAMNLDISQLSQNEILQFSKIQNSLSSALSRLLGVVENYPELRADARFRDLQSELRDTENMIHSKRQVFNSSVGTYNQRITNFPDMIIATITKFDKKGLIAANKDFERVPEVKFY